VDVDPEEAVLVRDRLLEPVSLPIKTIVTVVPQTRLRI